MTTAVDKTAIVEEGAVLEEGVSVGPFCYVGSNVHLHKNVKLISHVSIRGNVVVGEDTHIFPFAALGEMPQFLAFKGEPSRIEIGKNVKIREHVTIHPGTEKGGMLTSVGDNCFLMVGVHIAHDCHVGKDVVMANCTTLGGHSTVGNGAIIGGLTGVHQFVRIGHNAIIGGMSGVESDVIPYGSAKGNRATLSGLNIVGLKRRNFSREEIHDLRSAYRLLFANEGTFAERMEDVVDLYRHNKHVMEIVDFIGADATRSLCFPENYAEK